MDLEGIMLSELRERKTNTVCFHLYVESKKQNKQQIKQKQTHRTENKPVVSRGEGLGGMGEIGGGD